jgi:hypothetical protein
VGTDDDEKDKGQVMGGLIGASVLGVLFLGLLFVRSVS